MKNIFDTTITITTQAYAIDGNTFLVFDDSTSALFEDKLLRESLENILVSQLKAFGLDTAIILIRPIDKKCLRKMLVLERNKSYSVFCGNAAKLVGSFIKQNQSIAIESKEDKQISLRKSKSSVLVTLPVQKLLLSKNQKIILTNIFFKILKIISISAFTAAGEPHIVIKINPAKTIAFNEIANACLFVQELFKSLGGININIIIDDKPTALVFERGVNNFTKSCGTGSACIAAAIESDISRVVFIHPSKSTNSVLLKKESNLSVVLIGKPYIAPLFDSEIILTDTGVSHIQKGTLAYESL